MTQRRSAGTGDGAAPQSPEAAAPEPGAAAGRVSRRRLVEGLVLAGLPVGAFLSALATVFARFVLIPSYAESDLEVTGWAAHSLTWSWNLSCTVLPLLALAASLLLTRSTVLRVALGLVFFHVWLVAFVLTVVGFFLPVLAG